MLTLRPLLFSYPGCVCPPEYTGPHCEFLKLAEERIRLTPTPSERSTGLKLFITATCLLIPAAVFYGYKKVRGQSSRSKTAAVEAAHFEDEADHSDDEDDMMEEVDFELEDIELY